MWEGDPSVSPRAALSSACMQGNNAAWCGVAEQSPWAALKLLPWNRICSICAHWHHCDLTQSPFLLLLLHNEINYTLLFGRATQQRSLLLLVPCHNGGTAAVTTVGTFQRGRYEDPDLSCAGVALSWNCSRGTQGAPHLLPSSTQPLLFIPG